MSALTDVLHRLAEAAHRPADHPLDELAAAIDALEGAPDPGPAAPPQPAPGPAPHPDISEPDTPAPIFPPPPVTTSVSGQIFPAEPAPFGSESAPGA